MSDNKTIAKNTLFLYFRMILVMGVGLYTSRIVLRELGVSDFGIYSLVGGFITIFGFLNAAMSSATQRYLTFDLGKKDFDRLRKTFSISLTIHVGIALLVLLMAETIGLWYVNYKMVFPSERSFAVNVVYQFSILASLVGIIQVPYDALIIAHERMGVYAYVSIAEALLKMIIVFLLVYFGSDKLITYAVLVFIVALGIRLFYQFYCREHYPESRYKFYRDGKYYKELISFSGWNLFGNIAVVARSQGNNIVLNLFFGTIVNAAFGIMNTVISSINSFVGNFQMASRPQIIKLYASDEGLLMQRLINQTAKFSFYMSLILMAPVFLNIDFILKIWLVDPPEYSNIFIRLALLYSLVDTISGPLMTGIQATGKIKTYQIVVGVLVFLNLPISYIFLKLNIYREPEVVMYVWLAISFISLWFRLYFLKATQNYNLSLFFKEVLLKIGFMSGLSLLLGYILNRYLPIVNFGYFILQTILYALLLISTTYIFGLNKSEKELVIRMKNKLLKR